MAEIRGGFFVCVSMEWDILEGKRNITEAHAWPEPWQKMRLELRLSDWEETKCSGEKLQFFQYIDLKNARWLSGRINWLCMNGHRQKTSSIILASFLIRLMHQFLSSFWCQFVGGLFTSTKYVCGSFSSEYFYIWKQTSRLNVNNSLICNITFSN